MKKEIGHDPRLSISHFFSSISFVILFISVAVLSFNVYILRREIDKVKADIRPLVTKNDKGASPLYDDYFVRSRLARQIEPGPDEIEPGPDEENTPDAGLEQHQYGVAKLNCTKVSISAFILLSS